MFQTITLPTTRWAQRRANEDAWLDGIGKLCEAPDWLAGPTEEELAEQAEAEQLAMEVQAVADKEFVATLRNGTAQPGGTIRFPACYAGDLMSVAARATKRKPEEFGFVARGHGRNGRIDNTPTDLLWRAGLLERDTDIQPEPLTAEEEEAVEDYLYRFDLLARVTEEALDGMVELSHTDNRSIVIAYQARTPEKLSERRIQKRTREGLALHAMLIGGLYGYHRCTMAARKTRKKQLEKQDAWADAQVVFSTLTGNYFHLSGSTKKRQTRLAEMYVIAKGIETRIEADSLEWASVVVTAEPEMHPNPTRGKRCWNGTLPHQSATILAERWALVRARLAKLDITLSGLWTREAHKDACPHVNFLIAFPKGTYREVKRDFLAVFGHSKKAVRMRQGGRVAPGEKVASFASYAMKYFMKGFNAFGQDEAADGEEVTASHFAYRRHGFFGIPALSTWRELRRLSTCPKTSPLLAATWRAVHDKDAAEWIALSGGLACKQNQRPVQSLRETPKGYSTPQVVGVREVELCTEHTMVHGFTGWRYASKGDSRRARCKGGGAEYSPLHRARVYGLKRVVRLRTATAKDEAGEDMAIRTRTPGEYAIVPAASVAGLLRITGQPVTLALSNPRGAVSSPQKPGTAPPQPPPALH